MRIWVVEERPKHRHLRDEEWVPWGAVSDTRAQARQEARLLRMNWLGKEFRVRAYERVEGSK